MEEQIMKIMKSFMAILAVLLMVGFGANAFAGSNGTYQSWASSPVVNTVAPGTSNDSASAGGWVGAGGTVTTAATGFLPGQYGSVVGTAFTPSTYNYTTDSDISKTSTSAAGAYVNGTVVAGGFAGGISCSPQTVNIVDNVTGNIGQSNQAGELGYANNTWAQAGNESSATFNVAGSASDSGHLVAGALSVISGNASTDGNSYANVDNTGNHQGFTAMTMTSTDVDGSSGTTVTSNISGDGGAAGNIGVGQSFAGGNSSFSYSGNYTNVAAGAYTTGSVVSTPGSVTATSQGGSGVFLSGHVGAVPAD
jgi:hypothetical protein